MSSVGIPVEAYGERFLKGKPFFVQKRPLGYRVIGNMPKDLNYYRRMTVRGVPYRVHKDAEFFNLPIFFLFG